jgi:DNA-binding CsgD family transcriptional regulator
VTISLTDARIEVTADHARWAIRRIEEHQRDIAQLATQRQAHMRRLSEMGLTYRQIGELLGMSEPRVSKIIGRGWKIAKPPGVV